MSKTLCACLLAIMLVIVLVSAASANSPKFVCPNAPKPTMDEVWTRLKTDPRLFAIASQKGIDPILVGAGSIVFDYCWGLNNNYTAGDPRWEREYWVRLNGFAESIDTLSPFTDDSQLTYGYRLKMEVIGQLVGLLK